MPGESISCPSSLQNSNTKSAEPEDNGFWQPPIESSWFYCQRSPTGAAPCGGVKHVIYQDCSSHLKSLIITGSVTATVGPGLWSLTGKRDRDDKPNNNRFKKESIQSLCLISILRGKHSMFKNNKECNGNKVTKDEQVGSGCIFPYRGNKANDGRLYVLSATGKMRRSEPWVSPVNKWFCPFCDKRLQMEVTARVRPHGFVTTQSNQNSA